MFKTRYNTHLLCFRRARAGYRPRISQTTTSLITQEAGNISTGDDGDDDETAAP